MYGNFVHATNDASHYTKPPNVQVLSTQVRHLIRAFRIVPWRQQLRVHLGLDVRVNSPVAHWSPRRNNPDVEGCARFVTVARSLFSRRHITARHHATPAHQSVRRRDIIHCARTWFEQYRPTTHQHMNHSSEIFPGVTDSTAASIKPFPRRARRERNYLRHRLAGCRFDPCFIFIFIHPNGEQYSSTIENIKRKKHLN